MNIYKKLWKQLKLNITDQSTLDLMKQYEQDNIRQVKKRARNRCRQYTIVLRDQPWYYTYNRVQQILFQKIARGTIPSKMHTDFRREFAEKMKLLANKTISDKDMGNWLKLKHTELMAIRKDPAKLIKKPMTTPSGFKRDTRSRLSLEERAAIVIDELVHRFKPKIPSNAPDLNLDFEKYEEDWKQELWTWCWECKDRDPNLKILVDKYNRLPNNEYAFRTANFLSRMNKHILSYIAKLQYSCNDVASFYLNEKVREEELYPADDLSVIETMAIEPLERENYIQDDIDLTELDNKMLAKKIMDYLDEEYATTKYKPEKWLRYKKVLEMRTGFNEEDRVYSLGEIGKEFGVTRERIRQMEVNVLHYIRWHFKIVE